MVYNVDNGTTKQVTDGLADASWPAWDASGKYLWFLASTDFGLKSQWLDMSNADHDENFGLYLAVLNKSDPSPLLPESDEERRPAAVAGGGGRGGRGGGAAASEPDAAAPAERPAPAPTAPHFLLHHVADAAGIRRRGRISGRGRVWSRAANAGPK